MSNLHNTFPLKICIIDIFESNIFIWEIFEIFSKYKENMHVYRNARQNVTQFLEHKSYYAHNIKWDKYFFLISNITSKEYLRYNEFFVYVLILLNLYKIKLLQISFT